MRKIMGAFAAIATVSVIGLNASVVKANLAVDGDFETPGATGDWTYFNGALNNNDATNANSGSREFKGGPDGGFGTPGAFETFAASPGQQYDLSGFAKLDPTSNITGGGSYFDSVQITFFSGPNGTGSNIFNKLGNSPTALGVYTAVDTGIVTAPAGTQSVQIFALMQAGNGDKITGYVDDVNLVQTNVPEPASLGLLGVMSAATLLRRRKA